MYGECAYQWSHLKCEGEGSDYGDAKGRGKIEPITWSSAETLCCCYFECFLQQCGSVQDYQLKNLDFFLGQFPSSFLAWPLFHSTDRMAKASTLAETLAKELQCGFCSQQYKEPRVLPCLHSFCKSCLEEMLSKQGIGWKVGCPWCRASVEVSCWF